MMRLFLTRRWIGLLCLTVVAAGLMVLLGRWQWDRYEARHEINARIDASASAQPVPFTPGASPPEWTRVAVTGQFDPSLEILVRNRTVAGRVGFEILTPLLLADGSAVLVDRGWVPPHSTGLTVDPQVPAPPRGTVTVTGLVRESESGARVQLRDGRWQARRVGVAEIGAELPYPIAPVYVLADDQSTELVPVPAEHENDWLNFGYAFQWWIFAGASFFALYWLARRESRAGRAVSGERDVAQEESLR